jgi:hypothetical protein
VSEAPITLDELLNLKMLPAWVNEPAPARSYPSYEYTEERRQPSRDHQPRHRHGQKGKRPTRGFQTQPVKPDKNKAGRDRALRRSPSSLPDESVRPSEKAEARYAIQISVRFLPHSPALGSVITQIKENPIAYSIFALARLFLAKPERYDVRLTASGEAPIFQLGEGGPVSLDGQYLERNAFRLAQSRFYTVEVTQSEPIRGNFTNVARCKLSGTLLGPTNHHDYQKHLRSLFERRFSRRMSFADYQRQIEIVNEPALIEQWKEEARKITTYSLINAEAPKAFASAIEAERHFRENYLPGLIRTITDLTIDGPSSRCLSDRVLHRFVEDEWSRAIRSPSQMMQELAGEFRQAGLHIFRHRRGMLFVSPIRARPLVQDGAAVSPSVQSIIETLAAAPRISRKELAEKLIVNPPGQDPERAKLGLAGDLHWLVREGHVIEFNDGSLDLPRVKAVEAVVPAANDGSAALAPDEKQLAPSTESS